MNNQNKIKKAKQSICLNALTVIQQYLPANFTFSRLAGTSKKVRQALFTCALRKNRHLYLFVQDKDLAPLSHLDVKQMVEFAEFITLTVGQGDNPDSNYWIKNLDLISEHLMWTLSIYKYDENYKNTMIFACSQNSTLSSALASSTDWLLKQPPIINHFRKGGLYHFLQLMTLVKGFKRFKIQNLKFQYSSDKNRPSWNQCDPLSRTRITELDNAKLCIETLTFKDTNFYGCFHWDFCHIYRNLKILYLFNLKVSKDSKFRPFGQLLILKVSGAQTMNYSYQNEKYSHAFNGLSITTLASMLYGSHTFKHTDKQSSILHFEADVNFRQSFDNNQQNYKAFMKQLQFKLASIGTIPTCKLTDYDSVLSFEMIYVFLISVAQFEYTHNYDPIELRVAKFSYCSDKYDPAFAKMKVNDTLSAYVGEMKLDIISIDENEKNELIMKMRLMDQKARELTLIVERNRQGSIFEIADIHNKENSASAISIQSSISNKRKVIQ